MVMSLTAQEAFISQLWDLDTTEIIDPIDVKTTAEGVENIKTKLFKGITQKQDEIYVSLLWKNGYLLIYYSATALEEYLYIPQLKSFWNK